MRKLMFAMFCVLALAALAPAQILTTPVVQTTDPAGNCTVQAAQMVVNTTTQKLFVCNSSTGVWTATTALGGGTTGTGAVVLQSAPTIKLPVVGDTTDATKTVQFSTSGATTGTKTTLTFAQTADRVVTFPDAAITVPGTITTDCGSSATCATPTTRSSTAKIVVGTIAFSAATTATVSGISPAFTSSSSYTCYASDPSHSYTITISNVSSSSFTITAGTSNSDTWSYQCVGY